MILQRNLEWTTDTFLLISRTTNVLLFKFRCDIFIGVRIIKEIPGSLASGTPCMFCGKTPHFSHNECTPVQISLRYFHWC